MKIRFFTIRFFIFLFIILLGFFLRFYNVANDPPGLYIDEVSIGNNAYAILTTGKDEYGVAYPLFFKAFGEYKLPAAIYLTTISMAIFGKTEFAIRFHSIVFGTFTVLLLYFFTKELIIAAKVQQEKLYKHLPFVSMALLAIAPWHIHFSRGGFEANIALFFYLFALYSILRAWNQKTLLYLVSSAVFFALTIYTYAVYRILTPVTLFLLTLFFFKSKKLHWKKIAIYLIAIVVLFVPMILFSFSSGGMMRFSQTSAFSNISINLYPMIYLKNYIAYFSPHYLFVTGDSIGRHQMPWFGLIPLWQIPFLLSGIFILFRKNNIVRSTVVGLLLLSPLAAALTIPSPHTLRSLTMVVPLTLLTGVGLSGLYQARMRLSRVLVIIILFIGFFESIIFVHFYLVHYPKVNALDWGGAYKQVVQEASKENTHYAAIVIDSRMSDAKPYFQFYDKSLSPIIITDSWKRPKNLEGKKLLFIRPYGIASGGKLVRNIFFPYSINNDIFVQFWEI